MREMKFMYVSTDKTGKNISGVFTIMHLPFLEIAGTIHDTEFKEMFN